LPLEFQAVFTSRVSQGFNTTMVFKTGAIKCNFSDASGFRTLGNQLTNFGGCINVTGRFSAQISLNSGSSRQDGSAIGRDDLSINVSGRAMNAQTHRGFFTNIYASFGSTAQTSFFLLIHGLDLTFSWLLYDARFHQHSEHPCLYTAQADDSHGSLQQPDQRSAYQYL